MARLGPAALMRLLDAVTDDESLADAYIQMEDLPQRIAAGEERLAANWPKQFPVGPMGDPWLVDLRLYMGLCDVRDRIEAMTAALDGDVRARVRALVMRRVLDEAGPDGCGGGGGIRRADRVREATDAGNDEPDHSGRVGADHRNQGQGERR